MSEVILAGYNIDYELIQQIKTIAKDQDLIRQSKRPLPDLPSEETYTPETLSAAYARISRYPQPIPELRKIARNEVAKARKSNETIIFGLGHSSVAEHAVFNFDILHLSRLGVEFLERFRLASFTEKSQRYITLDGDYVIPEEIRHTPFESRFQELIERQNQTYQHFFNTLYAYMKQKHADMMETSGGKRTVEGWAKEDARYAISLATEAQLGMTVNARTLEYMIARARAHPLHEIRELGQKLYNAVAKLAPSIVKYPEPTPYFEKIEEILAGTHYQLIEDKLKTDNYHEVHFEEIPEDIESALAEHMAFAMGQNLDKNESLRLLFELIQLSQPWDSLPRFFETVQFKFTVVLSAAAFGQLKRHRMSTQVTQPYDPAYGITIPPSIREIGEEDLLISLAHETEKLFYEIHREYPVAANYILMNCHRRKVWVSMNLRELYHFARLRSDKHAQWDIRFLSHELCNIVRNKLPHLGILLVGKDNFEQAKNQFKKECNL